MNYRLLSAFEDLFDGQAYLHRRSTLGDYVALHLYEDLYTLGRSERYRQRVDSGLSVLNTSNRRRGVKARRGDGSFGEIIPNTTPQSDTGYIVRRGTIATIEIGIEVKILMKAMGKQIDRVLNDLTGQVQHFRARGDAPICVGVVGVNRAPYTTTYEGERSYRTNGKKYKHPVDEADEIEKRLLREAAPAFDEFVVLRFLTTNESPYEFTWDDDDKTRLDYGASLVRVSQQYQARS